MRIVTAKEMRALEAKAAAKFGLTERAMMENAGRSIVHMMATEFVPENIVVLCGPGNNGGDGLVAARILKEYGREVRVLLAVASSALRGENLVQYRRTVESGVNVSEPGEPDYERALSQPHEFDTAFDCLLGTGAEGAPKGEVARLIEWVSGAPVAVVSADIPSGIECDTGIAHGVFVRADITVTLGLPKPFLFQNQGAGASGNWYVGDIGLPNELTSKAGRAWMLGRDWFFETAPIRRRDANKRSAGTVLIVAGSDMYPGAAVLAARGAYRTGAGLVVVAGTGSTIEAIRAHIPECPLLRLPEKDGGIAAESAKLIIDQSSSFDAVCIGPGLGRSEAVAQFLEAALSQIEVPTVIDADALFFLNERSSIPAQSVITPHEGEAARLLSVDANEIRKDRFGSARLLAKKYRATVVLKGPASLIVSEDEVAVNLTGHMLLATAGSGDVLSGMIAAMLAMELQPNDAAAVSAFLHGLAGQSLSARFSGGMGAVASDIADEIPVARAAQVDEVVNELIEDDDEDEPDEYEEEFDEDELEESDN